MMANDLEAIQIIDSLLVCVINFAKMFLWAMVIFMFSMALFSISRVFLIRFRNVRRARHLAEAFRESSDTVGFDFLDTSQVRQLTRFHESKRATFFFGRLAVPNPLNPEIGYRPDLFEVYANRIEARRLKVDVFCNIATLVWAAIFSVSFTSGMSADAAGRSSFFMNLSLFVIASVITFRVIIISKMKKCERLYREFAADPKGRKFFARTDRLNLSENCDHEKDCIGALGKKNAS